jgi:hypothetical protein
LRAEVAVKVRAAIEPPATPPATSGNAHPELAALHGALAVLTTENEANN